MPASFFAGLAEGLATGAQQTEARRADKRRQFMDMLQMVGPDATQESISSMMGTYFTSPWERQQAGIPDNFAQLYGQRTQRERQEREAALAAQRVQQMAQQQQAFNGLLTDAAGQGYEGFRQTFANMAADPILSKSQTFRGLSDQFGKDPEGSYRNFRNLYHVEKYKQFGDLSPDEIRKMGLPIASDQEFMNAHSKRWADKEFNKALQLAQTPGAHKPFLTADGVKQYFRQFGVNDTHVDTGPILELANKTEKAMADEQVRRDAEAEKTRIALDQMRIDDSNRNRDAVQSEVAQLGIGATAPDVIRIARKYGFNNVDESNWYRFATEQREAMLERKRIEAWKPVSSEEVQKKAEEMMKPRWGDNGTALLTQREQVDTVDKIIGARGAKNDMKVVGALTDLKANALFQFDQRIGDFTGIGGSVANWVIDNSSRYANSTDLKMAAIKQFGLRSMDATRASDTARLQASISASREVPSYVLAGQAESAAKEAEYYLPDVNRMLDSLRSMSPADVLRLPPDRKKAMADKIAQVEAVASRLSSLQHALALRFGDEHPVVRRITPFIEAAKEAETTTFSLMAGLSDMEKAAKAPAPAAPAAPSASHAPASVSIRDQGGIDPMMQLAEQDKNTALRNRAAAASPQAQPLMDATLDFVALMEAGVPEQQALGMAIDNARRRTGVEFQPQDIYFAYGQYVPPSGSSAARNSVN